MTRTKRKVMRKTLAVLFTMVLLAGTLMSLAGCGCASEAATTDAELTETTAAANDGTEMTETETDTEEDTTDMEETSAEDENTEETTAEEPEGTTTAAEETTTEAADAETTKEAATTTTTASEEPTAAASSGYTYTSMSKTMYAKQQVNVRSLPSTDGTKLGSLSAGTAVTVTGQCNETNWYRIEYNGSVGYVSNNYLTTTKPSTTTTTTKSGSSTTTKASSGGSTTTTTTVSEATLKAYAEEVVELVNKERKAAGLWEYETNSKLTEAAMARAKELATSYSHTRPDGRNCYTAILEVGLSYIDAGENIAMGQTTPEQVMNDWMASAGHYGNIMNDNYSTYEGLDGKTYENYMNSIGVGCYYKDGVFYWVQIFADVHTHTWSGELTETFMSDGNGGIVSVGYRDHCTNSRCDAYKDENGVVHEHED